MYAFRVTINIILFIYIKTDSATLFFIMLCFFYLIHIIVVLCECVYACISTVDKISPGRSSNWFHFLNILFKCVYFVVCQYKIQTKPTRINSSSHHQPINVPIAEAQAFLMDYPQGERAITHHAGPVGFLSQLYS
jgi:Na+-transporting NADH:ubiquinone oxidoreductase subunit NqrE